MIKIISEALYEAFKGNTRPKKPVIASSSRNYLALYHQATRVSNS